MKTVQLTSGFILNETEAQERRSPEGGEANVKHAFFVSLVPNAIPSNVPPTSETPHYPILWRSNF